MSFFAKKPSLQKIMKDAMRSIRKEYKVYTFTPINTDEHKNPFKEFKFNFYTNEAIINGITYAFQPNPDGSSTCKKDVKSFMTYYKCNYVYSSPEQIHQDYKMLGNILFLYDSQSETNECTYVFTLKLINTDSDKIYSFKFKMKTMIGSEA